MVEIILGPPGTGKTTTLLGIVEEELSRGTAPEQIGFVSFTTRAATEARERAVERFGLDRKRFTYFRTLHSLCHRALGMGQDDVLAGKRLEEFAEWIGVEMTPKSKRGLSEDEGRSFGNERGDRILQMENIARVRDVPLRQQYDTDSDDLSWHEVDRVSRGLAQFKSMHGLHDFTDMLQLFVQMSWSPQLEVLLVDEAQDLSMLQWQVVQKLARGCRRVIIAGDDDQAIYNWAGAAVDYFVDMAGDVRVLQQSFRVPRSVQRVAGGIIGRVAHRRAKDWAPRDDEGEVRQVSMEEVDWSAPDMLVLARNGQHLNDVQRRIHSSGYMYERHGHPSIPNKRRLQLVTWEVHLRKGEAVPVSDALVVYEALRSGTGVARGHKKLPSFPSDAMVTMADLMSAGGLMVDGPWYDVFEDLSLPEREYIRACLRRKEVMSASPRIRLSTIHGSKGGEAQEVVLIMDMAGRTYREALRVQDDERRVWYVDTTRAKQRLTIVRPSTNRHFTITTW